MLNLTSFTCDRQNGFWAVPTQVFDKVQKLYGKKWNICKINEFSRLPLQGEQGVYDRLLSPGFIEKCDPVISNWTLKGLSQDQLDANEKEFKRFANACGKHWQEVQFWQGNCSAASAILGKLIEKA